MSGKSKGGNFEREIAKELSLWWSDGEREDIFYRSHSSGGRFTVRNKAGKDTALQGGDITASDPKGEPLVKAWSIEIKTGYGKKTKAGMTRWDTLDLLDSQQKETVIEKMWNQCCRDAELTNREPVLIFRRNGRRPCIMIQSSYIFKLQDYFGEIIIKFMVIKLETSCIIMPLFEFFAWIPNIRAALTPHRSEPCSKPQQSKTFNHTKKLILRSLTVSTS
jgi:hypothetical protein